MTVVFVFHLNLLFFGEHTVFFCFDFVRCSLILFIYLLYRICSCVFFLFSRISHFFACFFLAQYYYYYYFRCIFYQMCVYFPSIFMEDAAFFCWCGFLILFVLRGLFVLSLAIYILNFALSCFSFFYRFFLLLSLQNIFFYARIFFFSTCFFFLFLEG